MKHPPNRLLAAGLALVTLGCQPSPRPAQTPAAAQEPAPAPSVLSAYQPAQAYRQIAPGLLGQMTYRGESGGFTVEIWDFTVAPGKSSGATKLPGGAVLELRAGTATLFVDDKPREASQGSMHSIPEGASLRIQNRSAVLAINLRATVIRARN